MLPTDPTMSHEETQDRTSAPMPTVHDGARSMARIEEDEIEKVETMLSSRRVHSPDMSLTDKQIDMVANMVRQLMPEVAKAVTEAVEKVARASNQDMELSKFTMDEVKKYKIHSVVRQTLQDSLRRNPGSDGVHLPFQDVLPEELKAKIDDGSVGLVELCNGDVASKVVGAAYFDAGTVDTCRVPATTFLPFDMRRIQSRVQSTQIFNIKGDSARWITMRDLWRALSPCDYNVDAGDKKRFSLPTALMTLRQCGNRNPPKVPSYLHYDHPDNTTRSGSNVQNFHKCGGAFAAATKLMDAWNAMVWRHNGEPNEGTAQYNRAAGEFLTPQDCELAVAAISRIAHRDVSGTQAQADLFFCTPAVPDASLCDEMRTLIQPVQTITSVDTLQARLRLQERNAAGEFAKVQPVESDTHGAPAEDCTVNGETSAMDSTFTLASPSAYKWERPRDVVAYTGSSKYAKGERKGYSRGGKAYSKGGKGHSKGGKR